jgi:hypothetical protein
MSVLADYDATRRYAGDLVREATESIGLAPPIAGLGVAISSASEAVFGALYAGESVKPPSDVLVNTWHGLGWPVADILTMFENIVLRAVEIQADRAAALTS